MVDNLWFNKYDEEAIKDLRDFIPKKIFDVHAHIYRQKDLNLSTAKEKNVTVEFILASEIEEEEDLSDDYLYFFNF